MAVPVITSFSPEAAAPGIKVTIIGTGFTGTTSVQFGGFDAIFFEVVSDTEIDAWPDITGTGTIKVTNPSGNGTQTGFQLILVKVKITDLDLFNRSPIGTDLLYIWGDTESQLFKLKFVDLNAAITGGGGGTGGGNLTTALGSPFKVRNVDTNYQFVDPDSIITDIRLIGKSDYVVYSTDMNAEFDDYEPPTGALVATASGTTTAPDAVYPLEDAVTVTGLGSGSQWYVIITGGVATSIIQRTSGGNYAVSDTFTIADLPGLTFTVTELGGGTGNLIFDEIAGSVTIKNYRLTDNKHVTIYADGVVSTAQQTYILGLKTKTDIYDKAIAPIIYPGGIVFPWRKDASLIPSGWSECTDFRGKILIGVDTSDSDLAVIGNLFGSKTTVLTADNIPRLDTTAEFAQTGGTAFQAYIKIRASAGTVGTVAVNNGSLNTPVPTTGPTRIVDWIEYTG